MQAYKLLMNSLYGRFAMNPTSVMTEIIDKAKYEELLKLDKFQSAEKLHDDAYVIKYTANLVRGALLY